MNQTGGSAFAPRSSSAVTLRPALGRESESRGARPETFSGRASYGMTRSLGPLPETDLPDQPWKIARMNKITYAILPWGLVSC